MSKKRKQSLVAAREARWKEQNTDNQENIPCTSTAKNIVGSQIFNVEELSKQLEMISVHSAQLWR